MMIMITSLAFKKDSNAILSMCASTCVYVLARCSLVQCPCLHTVMFVKFEFRPLAIKCSRFGVPTCVCVDGSQFFFFFVFFCVCACACACVC